MWWEDKRLTDTKQKLSVDTIFSYMCKIWIYPPLILHRKKQFVLFQYSASFLFSYAFKE